MFIVILICLIIVCLILGIFLFLDDEPIGGFVLIILMFIFIGISIGCNANGEANEKTTKKLIYDSDISKYISYDTTLDFNDGGLWEIEVTEYEQPWYGMNNRNTYRIIRPVKKPVPKIFNKKVDKPNTN